MWQKINNFVRANAILSAFLFSAVFLLLSVAVGLPTMQGGMEREIGMPILTVYQVVLTVIGILFMRKLQVLDKNDFKFINIGKGFLLGWIVLVLSAVMVLFGFLNRSEYFIKPEPLFLLTVILFPLSTGLLEEVVFRGIVLKILLRKTGGTKKGIISAFIISAALFAVVHLIHLMWKSPIDVTGDLLFAIAGGMFLGAIYLRTKTLIAPILLHWLLNLSGGIFDAFTSPEYTIPEATLDNVIIITLIAALPLIIAAFVLLRKVKPENIVERADGICTK